MRAGDLVRVLLPLLLHALAREVDRALGTLLFTTLDLPDFVRLALGLVEPRRAAVAALAWCGAGAVLWRLLPPLQARPSALLPLLLRPALTLIALVSLMLRPTYPYAFTFPVALTQDWSIAQDLAALAAIVAALAWVRPPSLSPPRPAEVFFVCLLGYALLVPGWARSFEGHPGNEPKYLRMALALGHRLTLDVDGVDAPMESLAVEPLSETAPRALSTLGGESWRLLTSLPGALEARAIRASRVTRQTIRGKDGGVFHVLAPGPSLLLAPLLRLDRALNLGSGVSGRLGVSLLCWNALGAGLMAAVYLLLRDATARPWLAAGVAFFAALIPPFLFYSFQFYPELPGALCLAFALRTLFFKECWDVGTVRALSLALLALPWLHQKFLPVWALLLVLALHRLVDRMLPLRALVWLALPQAATLWLFALYNFAITGSARPDAMFLAWGPGGVTTAHVGQGFFGLMLDLRYGILPYAPVYLLAAAGILAPGRGAERLRRALPVAAVYYLTVASADDWHGAVSNLGRYFMPIAPFVLALGAVAVARASLSRGALAVALTLGSITAVNARSLWLDPLAANDASRLLARSSFADGPLYVPDLFIRSFAEAAPGLLERLACWGLLAAAIALLFKRAFLGRGAAPAVVAFGSAGLLLALAALLERAPGSYAQARFPDALELRPGTVALFAGSVQVDKDQVWAGPGRTEILVRSRRPLAALAVSAFGEGELRVAGQPPTRARASGGVGLLPLQTVVSLRGRQGVSETLYRQTFEVRDRQPLRLRFAVE
jgi:hypothetical protein